MFSFIRMKLDTTLILAGRFDVVQYSLLRKWRQSALLWQEFSVLWFVYNQITNKKGWINSQINKNCIFFSRSFSFWFAISIVVSVAVFLVLLCVLFLFLSRFCQYLYSYFSSYCFVLFCSFTFLSFSIFVVSVLVGFVQCFCFPC